MIDFTIYKKPGHTALYTQVPIKYLETFRYFSAKLGNFYRIRYRGPRNTPFDKGRGYRDGQMRGSDQAPEGMTKPTIEDVREMVLQKTGMRIRGY